MNNYTRSNKQTDPIVSASTTGRGIKAAMGPKTNSDWYQNTAVLAKKATLNPE
jgi:hypothetical protein